MKPRKRKRIAAPLVIALNALLVMVMAGLFGVYSTDYHNRLYAQNLDTIISLNRSSASIAFNFFDNSQQKLRDTARYLQHHALTFDEAAAYIGDATNDASDSLQLIRPDATGAHIRGGENPSISQVDYSYGDYAPLHLIFAQTGAHGEISITTEFTDSFTARKVFALYTHVQLWDAAGAALPCTLMSVMRSSDAERQLNVDAGYEGLSSVLIDAQGQYIIGSADFKSDNFYQYIYLCDNLSLDEKNALMAQVLASEKGVLDSRNSHGDACVYAYSRVQDNDWYCVSCVPVSSFRTFDLDIRFTVYLVALLALMMVVNFVWLSDMNRRLRTSVEQERIANSAKTDFLSRMSHDIRTPLNAIVGMTALAQDENNPPATKSALRDIEQSSHFLMGLVNDILDMNRVESGRMELHPEPYRCDEFERYVRTIFEPLCAEKKIQLTLDMKGLGEPLLVDKLRVNQIFFNLLSNAVKFTPIGGHVSMTSQETRMPNGRVMLDCSVRDDGPGMSEAFQTRMFDAFTQENRAAAGSQPGSGLGLAIVYNLLQLMGGTIRVVSSEGQGSTFFVHLEADSAPNARVVKPADADVRNLRGLRVLLCEDNAVNAHIAMRVLEKKGMTTDCAVNGREGVERFAQSAPNAYDVILMDIMMPEMDGLAATEAIRALPRADAATVPIIAMTANAFVEDIEHSRAAGMNAHLAKPISPEQLYRTIAELVPAGKGTGDGDKDG